jgi:hypothetical protein
MFGARYYGRPYFGTPWFPSGLTVTATVPPTLTAAVVRFLRTELTTLDPTKITGIKAGETTDPPYLTVDEGASNEFYSDSHSRITHSDIHISCVAPTMEQANTLAMTARDLLLAAGGVRLTHGTANTNAAQEGGEPKKTEIPRGPDTARHWKAETTILYRSVRSR